MTIYVALLRGINVGGKNKIKMADLKRTFESVGVTNVQTYIQSGNVLFASTEGEEVLQNRLEGAIRSDYGIESTVVLRTAEEFQNIIDTCPYGERTLSEGESIYACLVTEAISQEKIAVLTAGDSGNDELTINGREIYLFLRQSILDSKLARNLQKLGNTATTRNWNTMNKLAALAKAMKG